jgi:hypothetical protein
MSLDQIVAGRTFDDATSDTRRTEVYVGMRSVLKLAHAAAGHAVNRGAPAIAPRDVRAVVARRG